MLSGEFARKLRKLNPELRVFCGDSVTTSASIYWVRRGEEMSVCGCDKNWVSEHTEFANGGFIKNGGWRRALRILIQKRLVDRRRAERVFQTHLPYAPRKVKFQYKLPKRELIDRFTYGGM